MVQLFGATAGVSIGIILAVSGLGTITMIASYAFSGLVAGICSKFGKFGVVVGFIMGNIVLTYVANGGLQVIIALKEILIASLGLLALPKKVEVKIEDFIRVEKALPAGSDRALNKVENTIYALNSMSEVFNDMSVAFQEAVATTCVDDEIAIEFFYTIKKEICNQCNSNNDCVKSLIQDDNENLQKLINILHEKEMINKSDLAEIFGNKNCILTDKLVAKINSEYQIYKLNNMWQKKVQESRTVALNQLKGVSKAIDSVTKGLCYIEEVNEETFDAKTEIIKRLEEKGITIQDISLDKENEKYMVNIYTLSCETRSECKTYMIEDILSDVLEEKMVNTKNKCGQANGSEICVQRYVSQPKYKVNLGISRTTKNRSSISGDSSSFMELPDKKFLIALSDGMGSGPKAECSSKLAIKMLEKMLSSGFDKCVAVELINSMMVLNASEETFSTVDMSVIDLYKGNIEFVKLSAAPTYIKNNNGVQIVKALSLPVGILNEVDIDLYENQLEEGDIVVMVTDGIIDSKENIEKKELWLKDLLENIGNENPQRIADIIIQESLDNGYGIAKDDMTVIVAKILKN